MESEKDSLVGPVTHVTPVEEVLQSYIEDPEPAAGESVTAGDHYLDSETSDVDEDASEDQGERQTEWNETIYPGHSMTIHTSLLLLYAYAMTYSLTEEQLNGLLTLVSLHCITSHPMLRSVRRFKKYFADLRSPLVKHYYCSSCFAEVEIDSQLCSNGMCGKNFKEQSSKAYYIELPIMYQLRNFFKRDDFVVALNKRFERRKKCSNNIEDIYDGMKYRSMSAPGMPLSEDWPHNVSFTWNTDGLPLFKSSKVGIWPLYLTVNELPYSMRKRKENMIFYGLWFGPTKPIMSLFTRPLHRDLMTLENDGIDVEYGSTTEHIYAFLLYGTADLPAKAITMNMVQYNGLYSCSNCLQPGESYKIGDRGHCHIFPFSKENAEGPSREANSIVDKAIQATADKKPVQGIKGPSFLMGLRSYDYVKSFGIDYMHGVLLGVVKTLLMLWFSASHKARDFSIAEHVTVVDNLLLNVKPPHFISRRPRSISDHLNYWKASEFRSWLFYYSVPLLKPFLLPAYFVHYCCLVESIWILCGDSISPSDIDHAQALLQYFVYMMERLYEPRYCTLNVHQLLHLTDCVRNNGPLWAYSCFAFESVNGELMKLFHGTQSVDTQIVSAVNVHHMLVHMLMKVQPTYKSVPFVCRVLDAGHRTNLGVQLDHNLFAVGRAKQGFIVEEEVVQKVMEILNVDELNYVTVYERVWLRTQLLHSKLYHRVKARNSYTVEYTTNCGTISFGYIKYFLVHSQGVCTCNTVCTCRKDVMACILQLELVQSSLMSEVDAPAFLTLKIPHIHMCSEVNMLTCIPVQNIHHLCVSVAIGEHVFVCKPPNLHEGD